MEITPFPLVLASTSPRRQQVLTQIGIKYRVIAADCEESFAEIDAYKAAQVLAERKAVQVSSQCSEVVVGYDTLVLCEAKLLGKPVDEQDALNMLRLLSNREHSVHTGICLAQNGEILLSDQEITQVFFRNLTEAELTFYISHEHYLDKAGAYAIQNLGARFVKRVNGCYFNVVGLPVSKTIEALEQCWRILHERKNTFGT
ncbi:MAG: septum formation protein Maf [Fibrobacter sp.]|nr:septum formation protein Maf [Fibrobacter sp.]